jgi:hypothetical protein
LLEDKAKKATAKNATAVAEAKKRKGSSHTKTVSKRRRIRASAGATSAGVASAGSSEEVAEGILDGSASTAMSMESEQSATSATHEGGDLLTLLCRD